MFAVYQIRDYGLAIKQNDFARSTKQLSLLFLVMVCFKGQRALQYGRCIMLHIFHFWYWEKIGHPCAKIVANDPINFVEEDGEISLGLLAHTCAQHKIRFDHNALSELYQLIGLYRDTLFDTQQDLGLKFHKQKHMSVSRSDAAVQTTVRHFRKVLRRLRRQTWQHYPTFDNLLFLPKQSQIGTLTDKSQPRFRPPSFSAEVRTVFLDLERLLVDGNVAGIDEFPLDSLSCSSDGHVRLPVAVSALPNNMSPTRSSRKRNSSRQQKRKAPQRQSTASSSFTEDIRLTRHARPPVQRKKRRKNMNSVASNSTIAVSGASHSSSSSLIEARSHQYSSHRYQISHLHRVRYTHQGPEYLVHWLNFPDCINDTWEKQETLEKDCPEVLKKFCAS